MACRRLAALLLAAALGAGNAAMGAGPVPVLFPPDMQPTAADHALAARAEAIRPRLAGTPGQEAGNFLFNEWPRHCLAQLAGDRFVSRPKLEEARGIVTGLLETCEKGPDWPRPQPFTIPAATGPVTIDGKLDDAAWAGAATFTGAYPFNSATRTDAPATTFRLLHDDANLYFAFDCADRDIVAPTIPRDGQVYNDDCVEMFLMPDLAKRLYWEIVISPSGCLFDALHTKRMAGWGPEPGGEKQDLAGLRHAATVRGTVGDAADTDAGYTVEVAVPLAALPGFGATLAAAPRPLRLMLVRIDRNGEAFQPYAFQPLLSWGHNVWNHAEVTLAAP